MTCGPRSSRPRRSARHRTGGVRPAEQRAREPARRRHRVGAGGFRRHLREPGPHGGRVPHRQHHRGVHSGRSRRPSRPRRVLDEPASGFSQIRCLPAAAASHRQRPCTCGGTANATASTSREEPVDDRSARAPNSARAPAPPPAGASTRRPARCRDGRRVRARGTVRAHGPPPTDEPTRSRLTPPSSRRRPSVRRCPLSPSSPGRRRPCCCCATPRPPPGRTPLQVFLQRRVAGMAFAGGMTVFPGGGVDADGPAGSGAWAGPDPAWWGERLGCDAELAGALVAAAVRETFEECGVLLAGPGLRRRRRRRCGPTSSRVAARSPACSRRPPRAAAPTCCGLVPLDHPAVVPAALRHGVLRRAVSPTGRTPTHTPPRPSRPPGGTRPRRWNAGSAASSS